MPPRLRPTGRLLTATGWTGLLAVLLLGGLAALAIVIGLPRA
ncbi:hypothetical protein [Caulobacter sp. UC70_42]